MHDICFFDDDEIEEFLSGLPVHVSKAVTGKLRLLAELRWRLAEPHSKPIGDGVFEISIDKGPGYRLYYCILGDDVWMLRCGTKRHQQNDIDVAKNRCVQLKGR